MVLKADKTRLIIACVVGACIVLTTFAIGRQLLVNNQAEILEHTLPDVGEDDLYPDAPEMPPVVSESMPELLGKYESFLQNHAPEVYSNLQPGLTEEQIRKLEIEYDFKISNDVRELYMWRNGSLKSETAHAFPYRWFVPLDMALQFRAIQQDQLTELRNEEPERISVMDKWLSHTYLWIGLIVGPSSDSFYLDPDRTASEGAFFYWVPEDGYVFYPSVKNYIAQMLDDADRNLLAVGQSGVVSVASHAKDDKKTFEKYGARVR